MKKGILIGCIVLALAALAWFGGRKLFGSKDADTEVSGVGDSGVSVSGAEINETAADDTEAETVSENTPQQEGAEASEEAESMDDIKENTSGEETVAAEIGAVVEAVKEAVVPSDEGLLYSIETSAGNNLGMVPIVNGNAVVLMDGGSGTTHQGEYVPKEQSAFQMKLEEQKSLAASEGAIKAWAFYRESAMRDFEFPEGVTAIEKFAFARSGIQSVTIPEGVTSIGNGAFYHCDDLSEVTIPDSVTVIEENAFEHTPWLEKWKAESTEDFLIVGDGILLAYRGSEESPELPLEVKSIAPGAFANIQ